MPASVDGRSHADAWRPAQVSGALLLLTGALHTAIGVARGAPLFAAMVADGGVATVTTPERRAAFWFSVSGVSLMLIGGLATGYRRPLPAAFGWGLLTLSGAGAWLLGGSGFTLLIPQAAYIVWSARRAGQATTSPRGRSQALATRFTRRPRRA